MRVSRKAVEARFESLCKTLNKGIGGYHLGTDDKYHAVVDNWLLDYNAVYGGYVIAEIHNESGGESNPFGSCRHNASDMVDMINFALAAISIKEGK